MEGVPVVPDWIYYLFFFALGSCIGSFLNVVIYRLPRGKSLVHPGSACPHCDTPIKPYDNIPLLSWLLLGAKCRKCKGPVSPRYFAVELLTGVLFLGLFIVYFNTTLRAGVVPFLNGGWLIYFMGIMLLSVMVAGSGIDLELWIIPLEICWFATIVAVIVAGAAGYLIETSYLASHYLLPQASVKTGALALGGGVGLIISLVLLKLGLIKRSYEGIEDEPWPPIPESQAPKEPKKDTPPINHRLESCKEIVFLAPIVVVAMAALWITQRPAVSQAWANLLNVPAVSGVLGALWGYLIGCGLVWAIRIFGTLAFAKEAMGLGDVHLMGAVGAALGPIPVVLAFFIAPFYGLGWALFQWISRKTRQIPYGPFLSMGTLTVMIFCDRILAHLLPGVLN